MKRKRFLKIEAMKRLTLHRLASSLSTLFEVRQKSSFNSAKLFATYVKAKMTKFFRFVTENTEIKQFFFNWQRKSSLHRFFALICFFLKALRQ
jgi:hypothetical protein